MTLQKLTLQRQCAVAPSLELNAFKNQKMKIITVFKTSHAHLLLFLLLAF